MFRQRSNFHFHIREEREVGKNLMQLIRRFNVEYADIGEFSYYSPDMRELAVLHEFLAVFTFARNDVRPYSRINIVGFLDRHLNHEQHTSYLFFLVVYVFNDGGQALPAADA